MKITATIQRKFDTQERLLGKLYDLFPVGEEQHDVAIKKVAAATEEKDGPTAVALKTYDELGIMTRRTTYDGFQQQTSHLTLLVPRHEAVEKLAAWHQRIRDEVKPPLYPGGGRYANRMNGNVGGRKPKPQDEPRTVVDEEYNAKVALAAKPATEGQELVAAAGPDKPSPWEALRPLRKDEARALVEAAVQYHNKGKFLREKIAELRDAGFEADEGMFHFTRDERLETIGLVLPYFKSLMDENDRVGQWVTKVKESQHEIERLRRENEGMRRVINQQVRERVATPAATS